ncbi:MAG: chorismate synthase [Acidobacteriota bacterium]
MFRLLTAGESHGCGLVAIIEGLPRGLAVDTGRINRELARRQRGYGRGKRMQIERDRVEILSGVRFGQTLGSPVALWIENLDFENWRQAMDPLMPPASDSARRRVSHPRPGHADLAGALKYGTKDVRDILERASARETAVRVAAGGLVRPLLAEFGIEISSHVIRVGEVAVPEPLAVPWEQVVSLPEDSPLRCVDPEVERAMMAEVDRVKATGDTVGGVFQVVAHGVPVGLGSHVHWDRRLDGRLAQALMSVPAVKAVEIGAGVGAGSAVGSAFHDEIFHQDKKGFFRKTNRAGGIEGGISNGQDLRLNGYMKPLSTLIRPLSSVDLDTKAPRRAAVERTDTTAIAAAGVIGEAVSALVLCEMLLEKFGGDSIEETRRNYEGFLAQLRAF